MYKELINNSEDKNIDHVVYQYVVKEIFPEGKSVSFKEQKAILLKLPKEFFLIYSSMIFETNVDNGGLASFLCNPSGHLIFDALHAFGEIKAVGIQQLLERAIAVFDQYKPLKEAAENALNKDQFITDYYEDEEYEKIMKIIDDEVDFDNEFYKLKKNLSDLRTNYLQKFAAS